VASPDEIVDEFYGACPAMNELNFAGLYSELVEGLKLVQKDGIVKERIK